MSLSGLVRVVRLTESVDDECELFSVQPILFQALDGDDVEDEEDEEIRVLEKGADFGDLESVTCE